MFINRRGWLGGLGAAVAVPAAARTTNLPSHVVTAGATPAFAAATEALARFARAELTAQGFPGMTVALRSADGQAATIHAGYADLTARTPVGPADLFQIGSISKSLVAMACYVLAGQGKLDLDAPAVRYVPELPLADRSITIVQLLAHTAGLPGNAPPFASVPGGLLWSATAPGARYSYSNSGYDMLAHIIEAASGERFDITLTRLVLQPLGMAGAEAVIRTSDRARSARGYQAVRGDLASFPDSPLGEVWLDVDRAAGSVASTAAGMLPYLAFLARVAKGDGAPLFGPTLAKRFVAPVIVAPDYGPGGAYGAGLQHYDIEGSPTLFHTGGMIAFSSAMGVDRASGAGCFASVNIRARGYRPRTTVRYGIALMRALNEGKALPPAPAIVAVPPVEDAARYAGRWVGPKGDVIVVGPDALTLTADGRRARLVQGGANRLVSDHPAGIGLDFEGAAMGPFARAWHRDVLYGRDAALPQPPVPPRLAALAGVYRSNDPWTGESEVFARGDGLVIDRASGALVPHADGSWRFADPKAVTERVWFEAPVRGRPQRLNLSGEMLLRAAA